MCGIAGVAGPRFDPRTTVVEAQLDRLLHRGPDAVGTFGRDWARIGQTRLSIIDLVFGDPPITNESKSVGVALNGEIYNFQELRSDLLRDGHRFSSDGDTEVIAHLAEGPDIIEAVRRLDGMFAIAVLDDDRKQLHLVRDRLGKKPLYFWQQGGSIAFASEMKGLFEVPWVPRRLRAAAISEYLTFGCVPSPGTFFEGVQQVPPGHVLTLNVDGSTGLRKYWDLPDRAPLRDLGVAEIESELKRLLVRAVTKRCISDVPLGAFLSGGVDSSIVVSLMADSMRDPVNTFTVGFHEAAFDERSFASIVAKRFATDHVEVVVKPDAVSLLDEILWHFDEPFADPSALPMYLLSEATRRHVTVALSGDGGDEVFAGYERFVAARFVPYWKRMPSWIRRSVAGVAAGGAARFGIKRLDDVARFARVAETGMPAALLHWQSYMEPEQKGLLMGDHWERSERFTSESAWGLGAILDLNMRSYLLDDLLPKTDRMSMAHGLEVRCPLLDVDLVEFVAGLPPKLLQSGTQSKRILRSSMTEHLPQEIIGRSKKGFGVPLGTWFRTDLKERAEERLGDDAARLHEFVRPNGLIRLLNEHEVGDRDHGQALWQLLMLEEFLLKETA